MTHTPPERQADAADRDDRPLRVLVVEDDPDDAILCRSALAHAPGLDCQVAIQGTMRDAVTYLDGHQADVVLLDLSLPDAHGVQAVSRLVNEFHRIPVVVLTGMADERAAARALQLGAEDYLVKGRTDPASVGRAVRYALERRKAEDARLARDAADATHRARDMFVYRMSHELRTPLTAILGLADLLAGEPGQHELIDAIIRNGHHLKTLINSLIDVSRIEAGQPGFTVEAVRVDRAVAAAVDRIRPLADHRRIRVEAHLAPAGRTRITADPARFDQVMDVLLMNAAVYNREGGLITVQSGAGAGGYLRVDICDTGTGINPELLARLYTPFDRLGAENTHTKGTGLGLFVAKSLTEAMEGRLWHDSTEGAGTCARTEWPVSDTAAGRRADSG